MRLFYNNMYIDCLRVKQTFFPIFGHKSLTTSITKKFLHSLLRKNLASCLKKERLNGPTIAQSLFSLKMFKYFLILLAH